MFGQRLLDIEIAPIAVEFHFEQPVGASGNVVRQLSELEGAKAGKWVSRGRF
jgi:hypothetical protein